MRGILSKIKKLSLNEISPSTSKINQPKLNLEANSSIIKTNQIQIENKVILIDNKSFEIIKSNEYLFNHFCFVLYFIKGLIGFNMEPQHKADLLHIIKHRIFKNSINLAIGDGYHNLEMLQESDLAVEISKINEKTIFNMSHQADIYCEDFNLLTSLIFACSKNFRLKVENILVYLVYSSILITSASFYFFWYSHFNGFFFPETFQFFYQNTYQFIIPSIFYLLYGEELNQRILLIFPFAYKDSKSSESNLRINFLKTTFLSVFDSIIIFFFVFFFFHVSDGTNSNFFYISSNIYLLNNGFCFYYFVFKMTRTLFSVVCSTFIVLFFFILGLYFSELTYMLDVFNDNLLKNFLIILFNGETFILNLFIYISLGFTHYFLEKYVDPFILNSNYDKIHEMLKQSINSNYFNF